MPKLCQKCQSEFPLRWKNPETGKIHLFQRRKFCLACSPFGEHNTKILNEIKTTKICPKCKINKEFSEFYNRNSGTGVSVYCKLCTNQQTIFRQRMLKSKAIVYKGNKCAVCGYKTCEAALEFHHLNPEEKDFSIAHARLTSFENIKSELDKCVLVCANCHREIHANLIQL